MREKILKFICFMFGHNTEVQFDCANRKKRIVCVRCGLKTGWTTSLERAKENFMEICE